MSAKQGCEMSSCILGLTLAIFGKYILLVFGQCKKNLSGQSEMKVFQLQSHHEGMRMSPLLLPNIFGNLEQVD